MRANRFAGDFFFELLAANNWRPLRGRAKAGAQPEADASRFRLGTPGWQNPNLARQYLFVQHEFSLALLPQGGHALRSSGKKKIEKKAPLQRRKRGARAEFRKLCFEARRRKERKRGKEKHPARIASDPVRPRTEICFQGGSARWSAGYAPRKPPKAACCFVQNEIRKIFWYVNGGRHAEPHDRRT